MALAAGAKRTCPAAARAVDVTMDEGWCACVVDCGWSIPVPAAGFFLFPSLVRCQVAIGLEKHPRGVRRVHMNKNRNRFYDELYSSLLNTWSNMSKRSSSGSPPAVINSGRWLYW